MTIDTSEHDVQEPTGLTSRVREIASRIATETDAVATVTPASADILGVDNDGVRVSFAIDGVDLILLVDEGSSRGQNDAFIVDALRSRIAEMRTQRDRFADHLSRIRNRVESSIERAKAGMRLISFAMEPLPFWAAFNWRRVQFDAAIETLNPMLQNETMVIGGTTPRAFAGDIAMMARSQRRRRRMKARLDANHAVLEIDALADAAIAAHGRDCSQVIAQLRTGWRQLDLISEDLPGDRNTVSVVLWEGRIFLSARLGKTAPTGLIHGSELRIDRALNAEALARVVGNPAHQLLGDDTVVGGAAITSGRSRREGYTDFKLKVSRRFVREAELQAA
ncbi:hypothetical protein ACFSC3_12975 [Sphingomonas floccifaciens]|uniref:Uncharacterized protein n=1 Tax=Sphingomonas floccifaciens TaxID=1844115 RepID=A0ABW4NFH8_9SPHN|nr:hypothetical protein [Roseomonas aeriglobus]